MTHTAEDTIIPSNLTGRDIIFFDGVCVLCNGLMQEILRNDKDKHFLLCAQQSSVGQNLLARYQISSGDLKTIYVIQKFASQNERVLKRSEAVIFILKNLPRYSWLGSILAVCPPALANVFYNFVASVRYKLFGKMETCMIPSPEDRQQIIG